MADPTLKDVLDAVSKMREEMATKTDLAEMESRICAMPDDVADDAPLCLDEEDVQAIYDDAVRIVLTTRRCSTSWLQRKLALSYNCAEYLVEEMDGADWSEPPTDRRTARC